MSDKILSEKKTRVVIIGSSPLPIETAQKNFAAGIRTWHFARAAKEVGCEVMIIGYRIPRSYKQELPDEKFLQIEGMNYYIVDGPLFENTNWMSKKISQFHPDCVVGINTHPASVVSKLNLDTPFWADLNGSIMAEAQTKAYVYNDDKFIEHFFQLESKVLSCADVFSTVSESQGFSLVGELGIWGRLNKSTMGYRFVRVIPNVAENKEFQHTKNVIRGKFAKPQDFVVLYSGGYNTWTDTDTLFRGIEKAMTKNRNLVFVSTGGEIFGHDDLTYKHFKELISSSKYKDRFHLCGWVSNEELPNYYLESDLGINSDKYSYEAILGARTRILDWIRVPLPFISTPLSEITNYMIQNNLAYGFRQGNSDDLAEQLLKISSHRNELEEIRQKLRNSLTEEFTAQHSFKEFQEWIKNPTHAPDHGTITTLISKDKSKFQPSITQKPKAQRLAISLWPMVFSLLRFFHLTKYKDKVKQVGTEIILGQKNEIYKAHLSQVKIPEIKQDGKYLIPLLVKNIGNVVWQNHKESLNAVNLSYILKDNNGNIILKNEQRTPLPTSLKPGKKIKLEVMVTAPPNPGDYLLEIDLVKEREFWFSEVNSVPYTVMINVKKNDPITTSFPKVSVIVVTYNSEKYISECINSILKSQYPRFEIIVVDNSSSDNTLEILRKHDGKIKLIESDKNVGFAEGNNIGIRNSNGEIIVMINPDAYVTENSIKEMILPLLQNEKIMVTGPKIFYPDTKKIQSAGGMLKKNALPYHLGYGEEDSYHYDYPREVDYVTGAAMSIKKQLFEITGLFDSIYKPVYFEETDKCFRARKLGYKVLFVPTSIVYHYESTTLTALSKNFLKHFHSSRFKYIYKNYSFREFLNFIPCELKWFLIHCDFAQKIIVMKAHLKAIFSPKLRFRKKNEIIDVK